MNEIIFVIEEAPEGGWTARRSAPRSLQRACIRCAKTRSRYDIERGGERSRPLLAALGRSNPAEHDCPTKRITSIGSTSIAVCIWPDSRRATA